MNNTALRAGAQSANNTHMVFANVEHEKFCYEKLRQAEDNLTVGQVDCYHQALMDVLGILNSQKFHCKTAFKIVKYG